MMWSLHVQKSNSEASRDPALPDAACPTQRSKIIALQGYSENVESGYQSEMQIGEEIQKPKRVPTKSKG